jgi:sarcosine dehydrogenase
MPALETAGVKQMINGPESFTPDGNFILGEAPELKNFFVGAASTPSASPPAAAPAGPGRVDPPASRPMTSGPSTSAASGGPTDTDWVRDPHAGGLRQALHHRLAVEEHDSGRPCRRSPLYEL